MEKSIKIQDVEVGDLIERPHFRYTVAVVAITKPTQRRWTLHFADGESWTSMKDYELVKI